MINDCAHCGPKFNVNNHRHDKQYTTTTFNITPQNNCKRPGSRRQAPQRVSHNACSLVKFTRVTCYKIGSQVM